VKHEVNRLPLDTVLQGDCRELLATLPSNSVDLVFADPPYNLQLRGELWRPNLTHVDAVDDDWDKFASFAEYDAFTRAWLGECRRIMKDNATLWVIGSYHNIYRVGAILQELGFWILNDVTWVKSNPMPNFRGTRFCNAHETLLWVKKSEKQAKYTFNYQSLKAGNEDLQMRSDWHIPICTGEERLKLNGEKAHATQKPEALIHRILRACTNPGDTVLDPFFGTGTTGAVAKRMGRNWVGIEREETYARLAASRIQEVVPPLVPDEDVPPPLDNPKLRIPFAALIEHGLLHAGDELRLGRTEHIGVVHEDGTISSGRHRASIHKVGSLCLNKPSCNGWDHWFFRDRRTGEYLSLDTLREVIRKAISTAPSQEMMEAMDRTGRL
jgi:modification methylase